MASSRSLTIRATRLARKQGALRSRDFEAVGVSREALSRLVEQGVIHRVGRGLYGLPDAKVTEHHTLVEAALRVPAGVVCLLSALQFHKLSTQSPHEVWLALETKARKPAVDWPPFASCGSPAPLSRTASTATCSKAWR